MKKILIISRPANMPPISSATVEQMVALMNGSEENCVLSLPTGYIGAFKELAPGESADIEQTTFEIEAERQREEGGKPAFDPESAVESAADFFPSGHTEAGGRMIFDTDHFDDEDRTLLARVYNAITFANQQGMRAGVKIKME